MVTFHAHRDTSPLSRLIQVVTWGKFSHVSVEVCGLTYEVRPGKGVYATTKPKNVVESLEIEATDEAALAKWLQLQIGKRYDWVAVAGFVLWQWLPPIKGYWYCSELAMVVLQKALSKHSSDPYYFQRVSPQGFWNIVNLMI